MAIMSRFCRCGCPCATLLLSVFLSVQVGTWLYMQYSISAFSNPNDYLVKSGIPKDWLDLWKGPMCSVHTRASLLHLAPKETSFDETISRPATQFRTCPSADDILEGKPGTLPVFQQLGTSSIYLISAFLDVRIVYKSMVKIMALVPFSPPQLFCRFIDQNGQVFPSSSLVKPVPVLAMKIVKERCVWQEYILHCPLPEHAGGTTGVAVVATPCGDPANYIGLATVGAPPGSTQRNSTFGMCLSTLINYDDTHIGHLVQYLEINRIMGANYIYIYDIMGVSENFQRVLGYYQSEGLVRLIQWPIPEEVTSVFNLAQEMMVNDCVYRLMGKVNYVIITDLNELFLPLKYESWSHVMNNIESYFTAEGTNCPSFSFSRFVACSPKTDTPKPIRDPLLSRFMFPMDDLSIVGQKHFTRTIVKPLLADVIDVHYLYATILEDNVINCGYNAQDGTSHEFLDRLAIFLHYNFDRDALDSICVGKQRSRRHLNIMTRFRTVVHSKLYIINKKLQLVPSVNVGPHSRANNDNEGKQTI